MKLAAIRGIRKVAGAAQLNSVADLLEAQNTMIQGSEEATLRRLMIQELLQTIEDISGEATKGTNPVDQVAIADAVAKARSQAKKKQNKSDDTRA